MATKAIGHLINRLQLLCITSGVCMCLLVTTARGQEDIQKTLDTRHLPADTFCVLAVNTRSLATIFRVENAKTPNTVDLCTFEHITLLASPQYDSELLANVVAVKQFPENFTQQAIFANAGKDFFFRDFEFAKTIYCDQEIYCPTFSGNGGPVEAGFSSPTLLFANEHTVVMGAKAAIYRVIDGRAKNSSGKSLAKEVDLTSEIHVLLEDGEKALFSAPFSNWFEFIDLSSTDAEHLKRIARFEFRLNLNEMIPLRIEVLLKPDFLPDEFELSAFSTPLIVQNACALINAIRPNTDKDELRSFSQLVDKLLADVDIQHNGRTITVCFENHDSVKQALAKLIELVSESEKATGAR